MLAFSRPFLLFTPGSSLGHVFNFDLPPLKAMTDIVKMNYFHSRLLLAISMNRQNQHQWIALPIKPCSNFAMK